MKSYYIKINEKSDSILSSGLDKRVCSDSIVLSYGFNSDDLNIICQKIENGEELVRDLNSVVVNKFLLVIIDKKNRKVQIANDKFGSNQIYYCAYKNSVFVSDSPKKIFEESGIVPAINATALYELLSCLTIMPPRSIYEEIRTVPMASIVTVDSDGSVSDKRYWDIEGRLRNKEYNYDQHIDSVRNAFVGAVKNDFDRRTSIVTLSGGIDSGGILGIATDICGCGIDSITVGGKGVDTPDLVESSRKSVKYFQSNNIELYPDKINLEKLPSVLSRCDQPIIAHIVLAHILMLEKVESLGYKKIFYGYGTQMILGNLTISKFAYYFSWVEKIVPRSILKILYKTAATIKGYTDNRKSFLLSDNWKDRFFYSHTALFTREQKFFTKLPKNFKETMTEFLDPVIKSDIGTIDKLTAMYTLGWTNYGQQRDMEMLCKKFNIEPISPYIDVQYAEQILKTPDKFRKKNRWNKQVIRDMLKPFIPNYLYTMQGRSLIVPYQRLMKGSESYLIDYLKTSRIITEHIDMKKYEKEFETLPEPALNLVRLVGLAVWYDVHHDEKNIQNFDIAMTKIRKTA